jgi:hypothetical protein
MPMMKAGKSPSKKQDESPIKVEDKSPSKEIKTELNRGALRGIKYAFTHSVSEFDSHLVTNLGSSNTG